MNAPPFPAGIQPVLLPLLLPPRPLSSAASTPDSYLDMMSHRIHSQQRRDRVILRNLRLHYVTSERPMMARHLIQSQSQNLYMTSHALRETACLFLSDLLYSPPLTPFPPIQPCWPPHCSLNMSPQQGFCPSCSRCLAPSFSCRLTAHFSTLFKSLLNCHLLSET